MMKSQFMGDQQVQITNRRPKADLAQCIVWSGDGDEASLSIVDQDGGLVERQADLIKVLFDMLREFGFSAQDVHRAIRYHLEGRSTIIDPVTLHEAVVTIKAQHYEAECRAKVQRDAELEDHVQTDGFECVWGETTGNAHNGRTMSPASYMVAAMQSAKQSLQHIDWRAVRETTGKVLDGAKTTVEGGASLAKHVLMNG